LDVSVPPRALVGLSAGCFESGGPAGFALASSPPAGSK